MANVAQQRIDYNGTPDAGSSRWTVEAVQQRYREYARALKVRLPADIKPVEHIEGQFLWIYPIMEPVIEAIEKHDRAAVQIGIEFIEEDRHFSFGKILKSNTARALRRSPLSSDQEERIQTRIVKMLLKGYVPHEYKEYAKLLRRVGVGEWWPVIEEGVDRDNKYVLRYYRYFKRHALPLVNDTDASYSVFRLAGGIN